MTEPARGIADALGILLQRRFRAGLTDEVVAGVHPAVDPLTYPIISAIARGGPATSVDLAAEIGIDRSLVSRRAARLVDAGLVRTRVDVHDRRKSVLSLTAHGRRVVDRLRARLVAAIDERIASWPQSRRAELSEALGEFVGSLAAPSRDEGPARR